MKVWTIAIALLLVAGGMYFGMRSLQPGPSASAAEPALLKKVAVIDLPGPAGKRFDYLTMDYDDHYLLSAHLGVFDGSLSKAGLSALQASTNLPSL